MAMTRRDFESIAEIIKGQLLHTRDGTLGLDAERACVKIAEGIAAHAADTNERFDPALFFSSCGIDDSSRERISLLE